MSEAAAETPAGTPAPEATDKPLEPTPKVYDEAYVKELRQEAAKHRTDKNAAVEAAVKAANEAHAAELAARDVAYTELQNELGNAWIELEKLQTALSLKVPSDKVLAFTSILKGEDKDSITESAKSAFELAGGFKTTSPAFDPSQGKGGKPPLALNGDGILNAMMELINK
ncbi:head assembly protein [Mycolicibacterium aichiense]|uniref:Scaffolding protein n=1 Tax=Mycolicibacterium aichiense TaxID=1799 RepID=A0AAD1HR32_9MYCO|nr:head assembly protein [Mycolicibacterium aichiense]MCV7016726.1 head assembly protein [Mycolicibacterium aichiense]QFG07983.1 scaffolding protein [Mycobacterium phage Herbertwm]BBX09491.1 hypothetical protein MAIC_42940 [Mycolicibacterium aichiense]SUA14056.1 Uncharacterised protein [Mycolicibacterium aichiense]